MKKNTVISVLLSGCIACGMLACTDMDEYKKISGDEEIVYPGKIEEAIVYTGDGRVVVEGLCKSDPKIVSCRVYWGLGSEYVEVPVDMSGGPFRVRREIALPENSYNFDIYTYDAEGNCSIPVNVTGKSYGEQYKASLTNRLVKSFTLQDGQAVIEWWDIDATQGPYATEVVYTDKQHAVVEKLVPVEEKKTVLEDYDMATAVEYTTLYRPDTLCVDVFRSVPDRVKLE